MVCEVIPSVVGIGLPRVCPDHAPYSALQGLTMPVGPNPATGTFPAQEQGIAGALNIIEARLQALEQAVFGNSYSAQQINMGTVGTPSWSQQNSGPGQSNQAGATAAQR